MATAGDADALRVIAISLLYPRFAYLDYGLLHNRLIQAHQGSSHKIMLLD